jgi:hypothetical protein
MPFELENIIYVRLGWIALEPGPWRGMMNFVEIEMELL